MRVLAYNIQGGRRGIDWVAGVVRDLAPEVACLNEVRGRHVSRLAKLTGCHILFGPTIGWRRFGNAILTRERAAPVERRRFAPSPGLERRGMIVAGLGEVTVAATHLGLTGEERLRHADEILDAFQNVRAGIVAGDLNEPPDGPAVLRLGGAFDDAFATAGHGSGETYPSSGPSTRIDYVLFRGLEAVSCEVPEVLAADHRPVLAEVQPTAPPLTPA